MFVCLCFMCMCLFPQITTAVTRLLPWSRPGADIFGQCAGSSRLTARTGTSRTNMTGRSPTDGTSTSLANVTISSRLTTRTGTVRLDSSLAAGSLHGYTCCLIVGLLHKLNCDCTPALQSCLCACVLCACVCFLKLQQQ